jgi:hypothetical protein
MSALAFLASSFMHIQRASVSAMTRRSAWQLLSKPIDRASNGPPNSCWFRINAFPRYWHPPQTVCFPFSPQIAPVLTQSGGLCWGADKSGLLKSFFRPQAVPTEAPWQRVGLEQQKFPKSRGCAPWLAWGLTAAKGVL